MSPPDEVAALSLLIEPSLEQYLREFLAGRHSIAEVELAAATSMMDNRANRTLAPPLSAL